MDSSPLSAPPPSTSPRRRTRRRPVVVEEIVEARPDEAPPRKARSRAVAAASRNTRRTRRKPEEAQEEIGPPDDDLDRIRKRKRVNHRGASAEKQTSASLVLSSNPPPPSEISSNDRRASLEQIIDLIMWKNVAKSTLLFGFGSTFFLSSCFSRESNFSIISAMSHMGLLVLGTAFVKNTVTRRKQHNSRWKLQLTEDDILHAARIVLPVVNEALTNIQDVFSGDASITLKVAPILLFGANYGHLITLWRLLVTGFFVSFTVPKLYLSYSQQIHRTAENAMHWVQESWISCRFKRLVAASAATIFWNVFSLRTRIFTAFIFLVMLCYRHERRVGEDKSGKESKEEEKQKGTVVSEKSRI
uniref:Reticulon-like protein n=1 Tax=Musa acuminata subsp. malaccensis TaxID=214687 RepID=A0A804JDP1_MUSAM|nr:PREDICTED: reticulon-like protein B17 [Musa acuminata subsp. malaccensis]